MANPSLKEAFLNLFRTDHPHTVLTAEFIEALPKIQRAVILMKLCEKCMLNKLKDPFQRDL